MAIFRVCGIHSRCILAFIGEWPCVLWQRFLVEGSLTFLFELRVKNIFVIHRFEAYSITVNIPASYVDVCLNKDSF